MCCHKLVTDASKILQVTYDEVHHGQAMTTRIITRSRSFFFRKSYLELNP